jgi:hypothetical protein
VVCDSTWHHFVNVNLIGILDEFAVPGESLTKLDGFLSTPSGLAALNKIKNYYTNIGIWISPPTKHSCFHRLTWWEIVYAERLVEATLTSPDIPLERIPAATLMHIGIHARDVFGRRAGQCQSLQWLIDWTRQYIEVSWLDPWDPTTSTRLEKGELPLPVIDPMPVVDIVLGAALVALRQQFPQAPVKLSEREDEVALKAIGKGAQFGVELASQLVLEQTKSFPGLFQRK